MKKKFVITTLSLVLAFTLSACGQKPVANEGGTAAAPAEPNTPVTLKIGATPVPHGQILNSIKEKLAAEGVILEIKEFNDYVQPNVQVFEKQLDANFFQHSPYLDQFNADRKMDLVKAAGVHIEPFGAYSQKIKQLDELKEGASIAIPNDPTNGGRALALLEKHGLIKLTEGTGIAGTVKDIAENPKKLVIKELEAAMLPRILGEVDLALINTNYALEANLSPLKDALFIEGSDSPYVNILAVRPDNKDSEAIQKLVNALQSAEVEKFINEQYQGAVIPAFN